MKKLFFIFLLISLTNLYAETPPVDMDSLLHEITPKEQKAIDRGNKIIAALEEYYNDNGFYPQELRELVPKYLSRIERTGLSDGLNPSVKFYYIPEPVKYRPGYFRISYPDYRKEKGDKDCYWRYYYDSRENKIEKDCPACSIVCEWIDKISEKEIILIADAVKQYFNDYKKYPESLNYLVPEYLDVLSIALSPRYTTPSGKIVPSDVFYYRYNPLKDNETEFAQYYKIRFRYHFDDEFYYHTSDKKWQFRPH